MGKRIHSFSKKQLVTLVLTIVIVLSSVAFNPVTLYASEITTAQTTVLGQFAQGESKHKTLDMSSGTAFISDVKATYGVVLMDNNNYLSGSKGKEAMQAIDKTLSAFSPDFMKSLVEAYIKEYESQIIIRIEGSSYFAEYGNDVVLGYIEFNPRVKLCQIVLRYDSDPDYHGVTAVALSHEIGHAVHFLLNRLAGTSAITKNLQALNDPYKYMDEKEAFARGWKEATQGVVFARNQGMSAAEEDIATMFEVLVGDTTGSITRLSTDIRTRLKDPYNETLRQKMAYVRDITYEYLGKCPGVFAPLEEALAVLADSKPLDSVVSVKAKEDKKGNASFTLPAHEMTAVLASLQRANAKLTAYEREKNSIITLSLSHSKNTKTIIANVDKSTIKKIDNAGFDFVLDSPLVMVGWSVDLLGYFDKNTKNSLSIMIQSVAQLPDATKEIIGDRPVFAFSIKEGNKLLPNPETGVVTYAIPYKLAENEDANAVGIVQLTNENDFEWIIDAVYVDGYIIWTGLPNGVYGVGERPILR